MVGIDRPAINPDVALISMQFQLSLAAAVAMRAQRLQLPEIEQPVVTMVRRDVIRHRGRGGHVPRQTHAAQRVFCDLQLGPTLPAPGVVEVMMATGLLRHGVSHPTIERASGR
jgi:hypothetical protein